MSDKPPTLVLRSLTPKIVEAWVERDRASITAFNERLDELTDVLGSKLLLIRQSYDGIWVRGYEERDPKRQIPEGWRRERGTSNIVPNLRSKAGKAEQAKLDAYAHRRDNLPGLPPLVWGEGYMGTWTLAQHDGKWFASITVPLGQRTPSQTRLSEVNEHMWTRTTMSVYWKAVEKEQANA